MPRPSIRSRAIAALATFAVAGAAAAALAPAASAAPGPIGSITSASSQPTVYRALPNQPAGDWTTVALPDVEVGDTITIDIDDSDGPDNCSNANDVVAFSSAPTVTNTVAGNTAAFSVALQSTTACDALAGDPRDRLLLTATAAETDPGAVLRISNVAYTVGTEAALGPVTVEVNGNAADANDSNAYVSAVRVASADPARLLGTGGNQAIGDIVVQEQTPGAVGTAGVCIAITSGNATFEPDPNPTVAASVGNGDVGTVTQSNGLFLRFTVDVASTTATRYTISGIQLTTTAPGEVDATAGPGPCDDADDDDFTTPIRLGFVGSVDRIQGSTRYATAALIADQQFDCLNGRTVVLARGDHFADALAASYLAGKNNVPILLTATNQIPPETLGAIAAHGVTNLVLVGGTHAISQGVQDFLANTNVTSCPGGVATATKIIVERVFGEDRYQTAKNVAERPGLGAAGTFDNLGTDGCSAVKTAIVASGENFPDALAAGGLAYSGAAAGGCGSGGLPLLLTNQGALNVHAQGAIGDLGIQQVILLGGTTAVAAGVETAIDNIPGVSVTRVAGEAPHTTRQGTAVAIANRLLGPENVGEWEAPRFLVSRPDTFPDALTASALAGPNKLPLYLAESTSTLGAATTSGITSYRTQFHRGTLLGGTDALQASVDGQVRTAIASQPSE